jgi:hypothetical protein
MTDRPDRLVALLDALGSTAPASTAPDVDLVPGVLARLQPRPVLARRRRRRRSWALVVGVSVALLTGCVAIPAVRTAVLDLLHLNGLVVRQQPLPSVAPSARPSVPASSPSSGLPGPGQIGTRTTLAAAEAATGGRVLVPAALGTPDEVWQQGPLVDLVYRAVAGRPTWVVTEVTAPSRPILEKIIGTDASAEIVDVNGDQGVWVTGPQELMYIGAGAGEPQFVDSQLATASLIWEHDGVTVRVQADQPRDTALQVARSMR